MKKDFMEIIMNPVRLRIVQYLILHQQGTTADISDELMDIPRPSLYRHIKVLRDAGCIEVSEERKIRGTVEKTYRLVENPMGDVKSPDIAALFQKGLMSLMLSFHTYFASENADPQKDLLGLSTSTLMLTDEEYADMTQKIGAVFNEFIFNRADGGRKPRRITLISSPCEKED